MIEITIDPLPKVSKSVRILDMIEERGGMKTKEIQEELWKMTYSMPFRREQRGWWSTNLFGGRFYGPGLLGFFCERKNGRWRRRADRPHNGKPWREIRRITRGGNP